MVNDIHPAQIVLPTEPKAPSKDNYQRNFIKVKGDEEDINNYNNNNKKVMLKQKVGFMY